MRCPEACMVGARKVRERLRQFMAEHPNACEQYTLKDLGAMFGVSREAVRQHMPEYAARAYQQRLARVAAYVETHPEALLPKADGGLTYQQIGAALKMNGTTLTLYWKALGYPPKRLMTKARAWGLKPGSNEYARRHQREVVGEKVCGVCGVTFPWTRHKERNVRQGFIKADVPVCGVRCGIRRAKERRGG